MFGYNSGLGMSIVTFDWAQIAYIGSPLATPCMTLVSLVCFSALNITSYRVGRSERRCRLCLLLLWVTIGSYLHSFFDNDMQGS